MIGANLNWQIQIQANTSCTLLAGSARPLAPSALPGHYELSVVVQGALPEEGFYVKSVSVNGADVTAPLIDITGPLHLDVHVAPGTRYVAGRVGEQGEMGVFGVLVAEEPRVARDAVHWVSVGGGGEFSLFYGMAPGRYRGFRVESFDEGLWRNPAFLRQVMPKGAVVVVPEGPAGKVVAADTAPLGKQAIAEAEAVALASGGAAK